MASASAKNGTGTKTIQRGLKKAVTLDNKYAYFLSGIDLTSQNIDKIIPYIRGVSRIFLHKPPQFLSTGYASLTTQFKYIIETTFKSISGIGDTILEFEDFNGGFANRKFQLPQASRDETDTLTISVYELTGSPVREYIDLWVTGIRDPLSGIAHYHGQLNAVGGYKESNHTAEFIYCDYDPTGINVEYCCMFADCIPKKVPKEHLNFESGNRSGAQMDLEFTTVKYESPAINDIGDWYTSNSKVTWDYLNFKPASIEKSAVNYGQTSYDGGII